MRNSKPKKKSRVQPLPDTCGFCGRYVPPMTGDVRYHPRKRRHVRICNSCSE